LKNEIDKVTGEMGDLSEKLQIIKENKLRHEDKLGVHLDIPDEKKKKRKRRTAVEIERQHACPIQECEKSYGSEGSLNMHLKRKHPDFYVKLKEN
jgi:hypothetical protein